MKKTLQAIAALCAILAIVACTAHPVQPVSEERSEIPGVLMNVGGGGLGSGSRTGSDTVLLLDASTADSGIEEPNDSTVQRGGGGLGSGS